MYVVEKDHKLTVAEKNCVMTSSEEDMDDLNAFVNENLQFMTEKGLKQLVGDDSVNVGEILCGNVAAVTGPNVGSEKNVRTDEFDQGSQVGTTSMCPGLTPSAILERSGCKASSYNRDEEDRIL